MRAIETKYLGWTTHRPARIVARSGDIRIITSAGMGGDENDEQNHARAARRLCHLMGWKGALVAGATRTGFVFVFAEGNKYR